MVYQYYFSDLLHNISCYCYGDLLYNYSSHYDLMVVVALLDNDVVYDNYNKPL
jgi:hypothetical protein